MNKRLPLLRFLFIAVMLVCVGVLIWSVPATRAVNHTIEDARVDVDLLNKQIDKLIKVDHVRKLDKILEMQESLDPLISPELEEYWSAYSLKEALKTLQSTLTEEWTLLESDLEYYNELLDELQNPEQYDGEEGEEDDGGEDDDTAY